MSLLSLRWMFDKSEEKKKKALERTCQQTQPANVFRDPRREQTGKNLSQSDLDGAVFGAGGEAVTPVGEGQVEDLVRVLPQRLDLHAGDAVKQAPELPVPRHSRCQTEVPGVIH